MDWFHVGIVPDNKVYGIDPLLKVPTLVKEEFKIVEFKVVPDKVPASAIAVIVIFALPSKATPFIFLVAANFVAVAALPVVDWFHVGIVPDNDPAVVA